MLDDVFAIKAIVTEEDEWDDISSSDSEEVVLDVGEMEVDTVTNDFGSVLPSEILEFIMNGKLLEKVIKQIVIPPNEIKEVLLPHSKGKECLKRLDVVRNTALLCLNNVIQKLKVDDLEGPSKLNELWLNLGKLLFETDIADVEQVEAITRSLSAVARKLAEAKCSSYFSHMTESDLELLISICNKSHDSRIKVHMISILGIIGCLLGNINTPSSAHLIKKFFKSYKFYQDFSFISLKTKLSKIKYCLYLKYVITRLTLPQLTQIRSGIIARQINSEVDCEDIQKLLNFHNWELRIDELIDMHE
ncbi:UNVERIFIED_CONTAM: HEAT repeat-containing protein 3 [Trichonephila clavipes]